MAKSRGRFVRRPARVATTGLRARIASLEGQVVNISATGALIRAPRALSVGTEVPFTLDVDPNPISLTARIVRCQPAAIEISGAVMMREEFALGVMFSRTPAEAAQTIAQLCGGSLELEEISYRVLVIGDDTASNELATRALVAEGYLARTVTDARSVVSIAKTTGADAVVVNLRFEREPSTWWVLEELSANPATSRIPKVACVELRTLKEHQRRYLAEKRVQIVAVPFSADQLVEAVDRAVNET